MTVICAGYSAKPTASGLIELTVLAPQCTPLGETRYSIQEIATAFGKSKKAVDKLSRRKRDPLPLVRGKGRPFAFQSKLNDWLMKNDRFPMGMGNSIRLSEVS